MCGAAPGARADTLCIKRRLQINGTTIPHARALTIRGAACPRGYRSLMDTASFNSSALYGNGTAGDLTISSDTQYLTSLNNNYVNITVAAGAELHLYSGTILRCTGAFTNLGTVNVHTQARGGCQERPSSSTITQSMKSPTASEFTGTAAGNGECGPNTITLDGGYGGLSGWASLDPVLGRITRFNALAGGGGGAAHSISGGNGGGVAYIVCQGAVANSGSISADGSDGPWGAGGGGGGLLVIASGTSITNTGTFSAAGGDGGSSDTSKGAGGGGSGGGVLMVSPSITEGTINVSGGTEGDNSTNVTFSTRCGGGGGGPSLNLGGNGGGVASNDLADDASQGQDGDYESVIADPEEALSGL